MLLETIVSISVPNGNIILTLTLCKGFGLSVTFCSNATQGPSLAPLTTLGVAMAVGGVIWAVIMHFYWGPSEKYLPVIKQNLASFEKCFDEQGLVKLGLDCQIVYHKAREIAPRKQVSH